MDFKERFELFKSVMLFFNIACSFVLILLLIYTFIFVFTYSDVMNGIIKGSDVFVRIGLLIVVFFVLVICQGVLSARFVERYEKEMKELDGI